MVRAGVTYATVYGAILLGVMINICLEGIDLLLVLQYFKRHAKKDPAVIKGTILVMTILATLQSIFSSVQVYDIFIVKQGDLKRLNQIIYAVPGYWICGYFTAFTAEIFFCHRIWITCRRMHSRIGYLVIPALMLALMQIALFITMSTSNTYSQMAKKTPFLVSTTIVQGSGAALSDIIISATLCWIFHKNRSEIRRTNSMINKLITYAINRAIATGVCTLLTVLLFCFADWTYYFIIFLFASTHLYVISAVSMLTTRDHLRELADPSFHVTNLELQFSTVKSKTEAGVESAIGETASGTGTGTGTGSANEVKSVPHTGCKVDNIDLDSQQTECPGCNDVAIGRIVEREGTKEGGSWYEAMEVMEKGEVRSAYSRYL
ncbi:hypothetical protein CPB83DRAFT_916684 [Crepidotus variabilis]|uniref:DUF6534 domain-containing protein n=1 Tax=Crepidotus variabilis TaxID=179855 RepID=A0A9P6E5D1_9AGAR|nr:hypothetical protein CPB83DRAFT_916684 [Crepidotus variabilis]